MKKLKCEKCGKNADVIREPTCKGGIILLNCSNCGVYSLADSLDGTPKAVKGEVERQHKVIKTLTAGIDADLTNFLTKINKIIKILEWQRDLAIDVEKLKKERGIK